MSSMKEFKNQIYRGTYRLILNLQKNILITKTFGEIICKLADSDGSVMIF